MTQLCSLAKNVGVVIYRVDDFEFQVFGIVLVCHEVRDDALKQIFVDASGGYVVDYGFHALHEAIGVPVVTVMHKKPYTDSLMRPQTNHRQ